MVMNMEESPAKKKKPENVLAMDIKEEDEKPAEDKPAEDKPAEDKPAAEQMQVDGASEMQVDEAAANIKPKEESRLMITRIENVNFKSYAGTQTLGPFHKSFSSIVGPNGSGKSNVIDAMLFVFGYRSKKIRSKKLSSLIHNSENHQNVPACTVTVYFQKIIDKEGDDYDVVPNSQFTVSRTARKDGSSDYHMNGKKQTFKEVGQVLRACGIDLDHNRFLILQGEVESISMMKPKAETEHDEGMLEYLEDIIGSSRFKEPIEESGKQVEELNEKRGERLNRCKATEKEKDDLEGAKTEAMDFLTLENHINRKKHLLYQLYIHQFNKVEAQAKEKQQEVQTKLDVLQKEFEEFTESRKERAKEYKKIQRHSDKLLALAEEKKELFNKYCQQDIKYREDLKHGKANQTKFDKNLQTDKKKLEELIKVPASSEKEIEKYATSLEKLQEQKNVEDKKLDEVMASLKHETEGMQTEKESKQANLMEKQKVVNETKSQFDVASSELEIYLSQHKTLQQQLEDSKNNVEKAKHQKEERTKQIASLQEDIPATHEDLKETKIELETLTKQETELAQKIRVNRNKCIESRTAMEATRSRGKVLEALMEQKKLGNLKGIYGRLGDLGGINMKYDIAISTACGPLDNIVCDNIETAQKGVEFLKRTNIGRTTFIALDKMNVWRQKAFSPIQTPPQSNRLFDLIEMKDDMFKTAFYYALRDTLVVDSLDSATKIAYPKDPNCRKWRVVTLKGDLIETSGTMSGGGSKPSKGRMGCTAASTEAAVNPADIEKLEHQVEEDIGDLEELRRRKRELEDKLQRLTKYLTTIDHQLKKANMEIESLAAQYEDQSNRVRELQKKVKEATPDPNKVNGMEKKIADFQKIYKKASDAAEVIEKEVNKLHEKIMQIGQKKLGEQQGKVDGIVTIIDELTQKKTKAIVAIKTAQRNIKKAEERVTSLEKDIEENNATLVKLQEDWKNMEEDAAKAMQDHEEAQAASEEANEELERVKAAYSGTQERETEFKSKQVDLKHELGKFDGVIKENEAKSRHWKKEMEKLMLHNLRRSAFDGSAPAPVPATPAPATPAPATSAAATALSPLAEEAGSFQEAADQALAAKRAAAIANDKELTLYASDVLDGIDEKEQSEEIGVAEERLAAMTPNMAAITAYFQKEEQYLQRAKELDEVTEERDNKRKELEGLRQQRLTEFMSGFSIITSKLKEMYQMITLGGDAELELVDSLDPFSEGIVFSVRPPKKSWKNISNLSGGEKTLSSLALVFALHHFKPTPLYVMDEIDAALDFKNVSIVANYIKERTKNAQFIIISLRNNMFELADRLVGIYKTDNCTKSVLINPQLIETRPSE